MFRLNIISALQNVFASKSHTHGDITNDGKLGSTANLPVITGTGGTLATSSFESTATNIKMNGTQSVGSLNTFARGDHVHPTDTSRAAANHVHTTHSQTTLPNGIDLDDYTAAGWYHCNSTQQVKTMDHTPWQTTAPETDPETNGEGVAFAMEVIYTYGVVQILYPYNTNDIWVRRSQSASTPNWTVWTKVYNSGNLTASDLPSHSHSVSNSNVASNAAIAFSKLNITKNDIVGLGIPASDTDTTYTADDSTVQIVSNQISVKDKGITNAKIADETIESGKIKNGTIVNEDISSSAAIAYSKLSGVAPSSHAHGNVLSDGTMTTADTSTYFTNFVGINSSNKLIKANKLQGSQVYDNQSSNYTSMGLSANNKTQKEINSAINTALSGKPDTTDLHSVAISGDYEELSNLPDLSNLGGFRVEYTGVDVETLSTATSGDISGVAFYEYMVGADYTLEENVIYLVEDSGNYIGYILAPEDVSTGFSETCVCLGGTIEQSSSGETGNTVAWSDITGKPSTFSPSSHTHGDISNTGAITSSAVAFASGDVPIVADASNSGKLQKGYVPSAYIKDDNSSTYTGMGLSANNKTQKEINKAISDTLSSKVNSTTLNDYLTTSAASTTYTPLSNFNTHTHGNVTNDGKIGSTSGKIVTTGTGGALQASDSITKSMISDFPSTMTPASHTHGNVTNDGKIGTSSGKIITTGTGGVLQASSSITKSMISDFPSTMTPSIHTHGDITNDGKLGSTANLPIITTTGGKLATGSFGNSANTFCQGNDGRLSNTRNPKSNGIVASSGSVKDLNDYTTVGFYYSHINTQAQYIIHCPNSDGTSTPYTGNKAFFLVVEDWGSDGNYTKQTLTYYDTNRTYTRIRSNGSWGAWSQIALSTDSMTPASHTHGSITNDGKITTTTDTVGNVVVTDGSNAVKVKNKIPFANLDISKANITSLNPYTPASDAPKVDSYKPTGVVGTSSKYAREDHQHTKMFCSCDGGSSSAGYVNLIELKVTQSWNDRPITLTVQERGKETPSYISITPTNTDINSTNYNINSFVVWGNDTTFYLRQTAANTWNLIAYKPQSGVLNISDVYVGSDTGFTITALNTSFGNTAPATTTNNPVKTSTYIVGATPFGTTSNTVAEGDHDHGALTNDGRIGSASGKIITTGDDGALQASSSITKSMISDFSTYANKTTVSYTNGVLTITTT